MRNTTESFAATARHLVGRQHYRIEPAAHAGMYGYLPRDARWWYERTVCRDYPGHPEAVRAALSAWDRTHPAEGADYR